MKRKGFNKDGLKSITTQFRDKIDFVFYSKEYLSVLLNI